MPIGRSVFIAIAIVLIIVAGVAGYFAGTSVAPTTTVTTTVTSTIAVTHTVTVTATTASPTPTPSPTASPTPTPPPGATIIEMWDGLTGGDGWVMQQLVDGFNKEYGAKYFVVRTTIGWADLFPKLITLAKAGEIGSLPHIVLHHEYEIPLLKDMVTAPIDNIMRDLGLSKDQFLDIIVNKVTYDGKMYAIPWDQHAFALYFRTDIAKQYNIRIPPPACTTYNLPCWNKELNDINDFVEWLEKEVQPKLPPDIAPTSLEPGGGGGFAWAVWGFWPKDPIKGGGTDLSPKPEITADYSVDIITKMKYMYEKKLLAATVWSDLANCLAGGKVFSWIHGPWMLATFDIMPGGCPYGVAPILRNSKSWAASHVISVTVRATRDPKELEAVKTFLAYLYRAENNAFWGLKAGHIPAFKPAAEIYAQKGGPSREMFRQQVFDFGIKYMTSHPLLHQINDLIGQYVWLATSGQLPPDEAARRLQDEISSLIAAYG
ncbi:MAG: extracellular solute-binding protein [Ignisphaera sp.]